MRRTVIRYETKPERADENARLIEKVFQELHEMAPEGTRYLVLRLDDGTFVHFVETEDGAAAAIPGLAAFKAFQSGFKDRSIEAPRSSEAKIVGNYRVLDEG